MATPSSAQTDLHQINSSSVMKIAGNPNGGGDAKTGGSRQRKFVARNHWKPSEDVKLSEHVALHGPKNWSLAAVRLPGRSGKNCRLRWFNQLNPAINKTTFSKEEDAILLGAQGVFGNKWSKIAKYLPGRTDNGIKNRWNVLTGACKRRRQSSSSSHFHRLVSGVTTSDIISKGKSTLINAAAGSNSGGSGYYNRSMAKAAAAGGGCRCMAFLSSTTACVTTVNSLMSTNSDAGTSHVSSEGGANVAPPPPFIDFLGVGKQQ